MSDPFAETASSMVDDEHTIPPLQPDEVEPEPIDHEADRVLDSRRMIVRSLDDDGGETIEFTHDGANDKVYAAVAAKYAKQMSSHLSGAERKKLSMQIMREVAAEKSAQSASRELALRRVSKAADEPTGVPVSTKKRVAVTFEFGPLGSHKATYDDAVVADNIVLLASKVGSASGHYVPPDSKLIVIGIEGYPQPLPVMLVGSVPFNGFDQVLMVVASDDD